MCERECDCKTCLSAYYGIECGNCYTDSLDQCRSGGIHDCWGYEKSSLWRRFCRAFKEWRAAKMMGKEERR